MKTKNLLSVLCLLVSVVCVRAGISAADASRLGNDLTPLGGEKAGNADGSIPAWDGGITKAPAGYTPGMHHPDPFAGDTIKFTITGANPWRYKDDNVGKQDAYQFEHNDLFAAIRAGKDYNEVERSAISSMTAIMGRMATYSGKQVEWEQAFNSQLELGPHEVTWETEPPVKPGPDGFYPVAMPGRTVAF